MKTLIVGCGYLGRRVGRLLHGKERDVFGTVRTPERAAELPDWGIQPLLADVLQHDSLSALPATDRVFYCVGFDRACGVPQGVVTVDGLRRALGRLLGRTRSIVFASSTSVYGQDDGSWVDETSPTDPKSETGRICLEAEQVLWDFASERGLQAIILRFSGLYGPGRIIGRDRLLKGEPIPSDPSKILNVVHIDDAAAATVAAFDRGRAGQTYLVSDDRPLTRQEYYGFVAEQIGAPAPRFEPGDSTRPDADRYEVNRRISNQRIKTDLGFVLQYPDISTGIPAALEAESIS